MLLNIPRARKEAKALKEISLCTIFSRVHDPKGVVGEHIRALGLISSFQHDLNSLDTIF
jgi:hypothetical protein